MGIREIKSCLLQCDKLGGDCSVVVGCLFILAIQAHIRIIYKLLHTLKCFPATLSQQVAFLHCFLHCHPHLCGGAHDGHACTFQGSDLVACCTLATRNNGACMAHPSPWRGC